MRARLGHAMPWLAALGLIAGCHSTGFLGTTAPSYLRHIRESDDPNVRFAAFGRLADHGCYTDDAQKAEAVRVLSAALASGEELPAARATICRTLEALGSPAAAPALRKATMDEDDLVRAQACRALGTSGAERDATALARVMATDPSRDCRVAAIEALAALGPRDPRILHSLTGAMRNPDPAVRAAAYATLRDLTGEDLGLDVEPWERLAERRMRSS